MSSIHDTGTESPERLLDNEYESKVLLKDALVWFERLLFDNDFIASKHSATISRNAKLIGEELFDRTLEMSEKKLVTAEDLYESDSSEVPFDENFNFGSTDDVYEPEPEFKRRADHIPLGSKVRMLNIAKENPNWSLQTLQKKGCSLLKKKGNLKKWEADVESGGTRVDKITSIDSWTYDRYVEARQNRQQVTTRHLQQWALAGAAQYPDFDFKASESWVKAFKSRHRIRQRKITNFVSKKDTASMEEILNSAQTFRIQTRALIPGLDADNVLNTDQTGCQYQSTFNRTLADKGSKTVFVNTKDMNKVTHSYTTQYAITLSGKLLLTVYVCLQETTKTGSFGPREVEVDKFAEKYTNVVITSSKSGKLTTGLYNDFLYRCIKPYVHDEKFLFLVDSRGGQTNPEMYDSAFQDGDQMPTCTVKVIPPKCTPLVQPCDVYFYRQVKILIKRLQNNVDLLGQGREINSREDCVKIHSIVHHQLFSNLFRNMIQYAWFASGLSNSRSVFMNINGVCFPMDLLKTTCFCEKSSFIRCARCRVVICFSCFYDGDHCISCS